MTGWFDLTWAFGIKGNYVWAYFVLAFRKAMSALVVISAVSQLLISLTLGPNEENEKTDIKYN